VVCDAHPWVRSRHRPRPAETCGLRPTVLPSASPSKGRTSPTLRVGSATATCNGGSKTSQVPASLVVVDPVLKVGPRPHIGRVQARLIDLFVGLVLADVVGSLGNG